MNEEQANTMIQLLERAVSKLDDISNNISSIDSNTSSFLIVDLDDIQTALENLTKAVEKLD